MSGHDNASLCSEPVRESEKRPRILPLLLQQEALQQPPVEFISS